MSVVASMSSNLVATATTVATSIVATVQDTSAKLLFPPSRLVGSSEVEMTGCFRPCVDPDVGSFFLPGYYHGIIPIEDFIN